VRARRSLALRRIAERVGDVDLTSFYGHLVNDDAPTSEARVPDPQRMVRAYDQSARTLNLLRAFSKGGFADITRVHEWNQEFVASSAEGRRYEQVASEIERALRFMTACGIDLAREAQLHQVDVWTSHEGLVLDYEEGLTRRDSLTGDWYDCSAHMLWIGERTRRPDGAHAAFFAGVHNPLGVKVGPAASPQELVELCAKLDPLRTPGRLTLIARMGSSKVRETPTASAPPPASRRAASTRSWTSSRASSAPAAARTRGRAAFIWSSRARTSPNASAVPRQCSRNNSKRAT